MNPNYGEILQFLLAQCAAESYLEGVSGADLDALARRLRLGSNHYTVFGDTESNSRVDDLPGKTRMTDSQISDFSSRYEIVDHLPNTSSGFSATLMRDRVSGEYTLSFRSTEYADEAQGGDWSRDGIPGADGEVANFGFAVAQIADAEAYFRWLQAEGRLPAGAKYNVTGYSLGGHLATVFAEAHADDPNFGRAYTFNGAGRGALTSGTVKDFVNTAYETLNAASLLLVDGANGSIYSDTRYTGAEGVGGLLAEVLYGNGYSVGGLLATSNMPTDLADGKIVQVYGHADFGDNEWVANSGVYSSNTVDVFIEDQPDVQGGVFSWVEKVFGLKSDFGTTHSITLLADTLSVAEVLQRLDPMISDNAVRSILSAASNERASGLIGTQGKAESDSLEGVVEAIARLFGVDLIALGADPRTGSIPRDDEGGGFGNLTNRNVLYRALDAIEQAIGDSTGYAVGALKDLSAADLVALAMQSGSTGLGYRYVLRELNPFVVLDAPEGTLYGRFQAGGANAGELDDCSADNPKGLTQDWIEDRAAFLERKLYITGNNLNNFYQTPEQISDPNAIPDARASSYQMEGRYYEDRTSGFVASSGGSAEVLTQYVLVEGGAGDDRVEGGQGDRARALAKLVTRGSTFNLGGGISHVR